MNSRETFTDLAVRAALMVAVYVVFAAMLPSYHTVRGAAALLDGGVLIGLTALGIGITMIAGEFDLSVGSLAAVIGVLTVNLIIAGMSVIPAIAIAVAVGLRLWRAPGVRHCGHRDQLARLYYRHVDRPERVCDDHQQRKQRDYPDSAVGRDGLPR